MALLTSSSKAKAAPPPGETAPDIADLRERLAAATPQDTSKGMSFNGVLSAARALLGPDDIERVQAMAPEKKYVDFFNYPVATFLPAAFTAASLLRAGQLDFDGALRRVGEQAIVDFLSTPVGRTLVTVSSGEAKRLMRAAPTA